MHETIQNRFRENELDYLKLWISKKITGFAGYLDELNFRTLSEKMKISDPQDTEGILKAMDNLIRYATDMTKIFNGSPDSIYVADKTGETLMANKAFEYTTGISPEACIGRNVADLEKEGFYKPSVLRLVMKEQRPISVLQIGKNGKEIVVKGVPILDQEGNVEMLLSNARLIEEIEGIYSYYKEVKKNHRNGRAAPKTEILAESNAMQRILELVHQIRDTDSTVLISGESGVGKGMLAKYIHESSNRAGKPMVEINCGAIPENLLESELFGYNTGAFTGASATGKEGLIEVAHGGTLMLDEISELPLPLQVKLLKVIQDKKILRIGGKRPIDVDVRIIAVSNRNLTALVRDGHFRADLYYRLNVIPIEIPPLRERREDLAVAIRHFIEKYSKRYNKSVVCPRQMEESMLKSSWPGNMRELENYIERLVLTCKDGILSANLSESRDGLRRLVEAAMPENPDFTVLKDTLDELEGRVVRAAYEQYRSSYKVAEALGISQASAWRKIQKYVST